MFQIGDHVYVDMAGFSSGGVSMGAGVSVSGVIVGEEFGEYIVKLSVVAGGVDTVQVPADRLRQA